MISVESTVPVGACRNVGMLEIGCLELEAKLGILIKIERFIFELIKTTRLWCLALLYSEICLQNRYDV